MTEAVNSPVLAVVIAQILATLVAAVSLWWRNRQKQRDMAVSHQLMLQQISDEIGVIAAWINAYSLVAPHEAHDEEYSRARCDLERAYARLAETRELRLGAEERPAQPTPVLAEPSPVLAEPSPAPAEPAEARDFPAPKPASPPSPAPKAAVTPHWGMAIATVVLLWPAGIWAIYSASRVASSLKSGDEATARKHSSQVQFLFSISLAVFIVLFIIVIAASSNS